MFKKATTAALLAAALVLAAISGGCGGSSNNNGGDSGNGDIATVSESPDTEILKVNGQAVTSGMLEEHMAIAAYNVGRTLADYIGAELEELRETTLESIISNTVVRQYLESLETDYLTPEIMTSVENAAMRIRTDSALVALVGNNTISSETLERHIAFTQYSICFYILAMDELALTEGDLLEYYDRNKDYMKMTFVSVSHIVLATVEEAEEILAKLEAGGDFAALATEFSLDTATRPDGGAMPYFTKDETLPEFEEAAFSMEIGEISDPVRTIYGYHIIKLTDRQEQELEFDEVMGHIQDVLVRGACNEKIKQLRQEASLEYLD